MSLRRDHLLEVILAYQNEHGRFPTFTQMEELTGFSRGSIAALLKGLQADGLVAAGRRRAWQSRKAVRGTLADYCLRAGPKGTCCMDLLGHQGPHQFVPRTSVFIVKVEKDE